MWRPLWRPPQEELRLKEKEKPMTSLNPHCWSD